MTLDQVKEISAAIGERSADELVRAANIALRHSGTDQRVSDSRTAETLLRGMAQAFLDDENYLFAGSLILPERLFNTGIQYSKDVIEEYIPSNQLLLMGANGTSKCLGPDVPVMMFDGSIKKAKEVAIGDVLMGDDFNPRNVLQTAHGTDMMYRIKPKRGGMEWTCNSEHILTLRCGHTKKCGSGAMSKKYVRGQSYDIPIKDYLAMGKSRQKQFCQYHAAVEFPDKPLSFDPYIYGVWLGDGTFDYPQITKPDGPITERWVEHFRSIGYSINRYDQGGTKCPSFWASWLHDKHNPFTDFMRTSRNEIGDEKRIRSEYLINSRENRLKLLAGLVDTDGTCDEYSTVITTKYRGLADQIVWLARSLGFVGSVKPRKGIIKSIGFEGDYWSVYISGENIEEMPTLQKKPKNTIGFLQSGSVGIDITEDGVGEYYGFTIDGNRRFLLGDFTVTHNTWTMCVLAYLDFWRDPLYTAVKLSAVNEEHLKGTMMANVKRLNEDANLPVPCDKPTDMRLCAIGSHADMGISGVLFPQGKDPTSRLKGYRPKPIRKIPHPKWGVMSRTRFFGDEAQSYADGLFKDFGSLQSAMNGPDPVKLILGFNADNTGRRVVQLAMPHQGWKYEDVETLYRWTSKTGWRVLRLDGNKSENVVARKIVFDGIQTYEGYMKFVRGGADGSADYFEKARGWPPVKGAVNIVISPALLTKCRGNLNFIGKVMNIASLDCAYQGQDNPVLTISRYGMANYVIMDGGEKREFVDYLNPGVKKPRRCFQVDQQFKLPNSDPTQLAEEVMRLCRELNIPPDNVVVDGSGNGIGTYSHLAKYWGNVLYIQWGRKSTDLKVLHEDQEPASSVYEKIISEMWFTTKRWMESGCFWIATTVHPFPLNEQLSTRRYNSVRGSFQAVESKPEYKSRGHDSPDEADSLIQGPHLIRERFYHLLPGMQVDAQFTEEVKDKWSKKEESDSHPSQDYIDEKGPESSAHLD